MFKPSTIFIAVLSVCCGLLIAYICFSQSSKTTPVTAESKVLKEIAYERVVEGCLKCVSESNNEWSERVDPVAVLMYKEVLCGSYRKWKEYQSKYAGTPNYLARNLLYDALKNDRTLFFRLEDAYVNQYPKWLAMIEHDRAFYDDQRQKKELAKKKSVK